MGHCWTGFFKRARLREPRGAPMSHRLWRPKIQEFLDMCDYSLEHMLSRHAKVGDKLTTHRFPSGTRGFAASENSAMAVCVLPGTELAFSAEVTFRSALLGLRRRARGQ